MTYNSAIAACEKGGEWKRALNVLSQMRADGIAPGVKAYTAAIAACARASPSQTTVALGLLAQMKKQAAEGDKNAVPNVITYSAAINSCAHTGEWRRSLDLLDAMQREGLRPDRIAYNSVLNACRTGGAPREALGVWDAMIDRAGIKPDIISLTETVGAAERGGDSAASDRVFTRAVLEGVLFGSDFCLDRMWETGADAAAEWEVDVSGLTIPVARAAVRYTLRRIVEGKHPEQQLRDLVFITGVGQLDRRASESSSNHGFRKYAQSNERKQTRSALREHLLGYLRDDFEPALSPSIPAQMPGTILVTASALRTHVVSADVRKRPEARKE